MNVKRTTEAHDLDNALLENVQDTQSLPDLTQFYGKMVEITDGPEGGEDGVLIYIPHVSLAELTDEDAS